MVAGKSHGFYSLRKGKSTLLELGSPSPLLRSGSSPRAVPASNNFHGAVDLHYLSAFCHKGCLIPQHSGAKMSRKPSINLPTTHGSSTHMPQSFSKTPNIKQLPIYCVPGLPAASFCFLSTYHTEVGSKVIIVVTRQAVVTLMIGTGKVRHDRLSHYVFTCLLA